MNFKQLIPHLIAVVILVLVSAFYFHPQFSGKVLQGGDIISWRGQAKEVSDYKKDTGKRALWANNMFGGMPTYQTSRIMKGSLLVPLRKGLFFFQTEPFGIFLVAMIGFYIMAVLLGVNHWLAIVGAIAFGVATNDFVLYRTGHASKVEAIAYFPYIAAGILLAFRKKYIIGGTVFGIGMGLNLMANHPQMTLYFGITILIYGLAMLIKTIQEKDYLHFAKATGILLLGLMAGMGAAASNVFTSLDYKSETMRGAPILTPPASGEAVNSSQTEGLAWDYAMQWSNGGKDLLATFIPNAAGSGPATEVGADSPFGDAIRRIGGRPPANINLPLYHGSLISTAGPAYLGAVLWFLFVFGALTVRGPVKWWMVGGVVLTMMISMGRHMEWFNRLLFDYFPMFSSFRAPSSILSITDFLMAVLGILGLQQAYKTAADQRLATLKSPLFIAGGITAGLALLLWLIGPSLLDFSNVRDAGYAGQFLGQNAAPANVQTLIAGFEDTRVSVFRQDALRTFLFCGLAFGALFLFLRKTISILPLAAIIGVLVLVDFGGITSRYYSSSEFKSKRNNDAALQLTPADQQIKQDPDPYYRVFNQTGGGDPFQEAITSYKHNSVGGYHAAKLQRYDDIITYHLRRGNQAVFNMLNTKYFIQQGNDGNPTPVRNPGALGNAWLVNQIEMVDNADAEIAALGGNFNPATTAVIHQEWSEDVTGLRPDGQGSVSLKTYDPMELTYDFSSSSEQLVVFSEVWYGPDKGWEVTIDGQPAELIRANYVLRALRVPAGQHEIVMRFNPSSYAIGVIVAYISSALLLLGLLYLLYQWYLVLSKEPEPKPVVIQERTAEPERKKKGKK